MVTFIAFLLFVIGVPFASVAVIVILLIAARGR